MLSYSYKAFLVMDQLRRKAGISVPQLNHILGSSGTNYSRISKRVYAGDRGVLHYLVEQDVLRTLNVLVTAYTSKVISETTLKQTNDIVAVLQDVELKMVVAIPDELIDATLGTLLANAGGMLAA